MNDTVRGIAAAVAICIVSGVAGLAAGWLSTSRDLSGSPEAPRTAAQQGSQPASQQSVTDDSDGRRHQWVDPERERGAGAPNRDAPDERQPLPRQSTKESGEVPGAPAASAPLERRAASFVTAQVSGWSSANTNDLAALASAYADEIFYYGSRKSREAVLLDKRRLLERWPERSYQVQPGSITVQCRGNVCKVGGLTDWQTRSAARKASASGTAQFEYEVAVSGDALSIVSENSSVVRRN